MAIVQTLTKSDFVQAFKQSSRKDQFSHEALEAIFEYLEEYSEQADSNNIEFDIVAICCQWVEMTWEEVVQAYDVDLSDVADEDKADAVWGFLTDETVGVYRVSNEESVDGSFVFIQF
jgi:hypothetical protein